MKNLLLLAIALSFAGCGSDQPASSENSDFVTQMAVKTRGDATKLSPEERKKMDELTKGKTEEVLRWHPSTAMPPVNSGNP